MTLTVEAIYENGTLKLAEPLAAQGTRKGQGHRPEPNQSAGGGLGIMAFEGQPKRRVLCHVR